MKKYFVLVSCFVALLVLVNVSFAQQATVPCTCDASAQTLPFLYYTAPKTFADRLAVKRGKVPVTMVFPPQTFVAQPFAAPPVRPVATRRAARIAQPNPFQFPPVAPPSPVFESGQVPLHMGLPATQMGDSNRVHQRAGGAPTINFMSIVRAPRTTYDPYAAQYFQRAFPLPEAE
jgi:hypothetical protein